MKKVIISALVVVIVNSVNAQSLTGKWQEGTPEVTSGYFNTYQFIDDSTFLFSLNQYFGLKRIVSIGGKYKYNKKGGVLSLTVEFTNEIIGGTIERSEESGEATDRWGITGGKLKKIKLVKPVKAVIKVEFTKSDKEDSELVLLDKKKYYKVE
jgi:hypothetical protein